MIKQPAVGQQTLRSCPATSLLMRLLCFSQEYANWLNAKAGGTSTLRSTSAGDTWCWPAVNHRQPCLLPTQEDLGGLQMRASVELKQEGSMGGITGRKERRSICVGAAAMMVVHQFWLGVLQKHPPSWLSMLPCCKCSDCIQVTAS